MITFKFKVNEDNSVNILGMQVGPVKEIAGAGQKWRMWHKGGAGAQCGRYWIYGSSGIWIVQIEDDTLMKHYDFSLGRKWKVGRKIIAQIIEELNKNPEHDHTKYLRQLEEATRDWERKWPELEPIERLEQAIKTHTM